MDFIFFGPEKSDFNLYKGFFMKKKGPNVEGKFPKLPYFYNRFYYIASDISDVNNLISTTTKELFMKKRAPN